MSSQYQDDQEWLDAYEKEIKENVKEIKKLKKHLKQYQDNKICMACHELRTICHALGDCVRF
jgi:predicted translin family RNA/ssDNA-binding protein